MKTRVNGVSILTIILITFSILLLAGCIASRKASFTQEMMERGIKPIAGKELKQLLTGAEQYENKTNGYEGSFHFLADGKIKGKIWGAWGVKNAEGKWSINEKGLLCMEWLEGDFGTDDGEHCYSYYPKADKNEYVRVLITGSSSKSWPDGITPVAIKPEN